MTHFTATSTRRWLAGLAAISLAATGLIGLAPEAAAAPPVTSPASAKVKDTREFEGARKNPRTVDLNRSEKKKFAASASDAARDAKAARTAKRKVSAAAETATGTPIGGTKPWLLLDDINGVDADDYVLRGVGDHIEIWVQADTTFPEGDCRNAAGLTEITDAQVQSMVAEYDGNILPTESEAFSVAPERDGTQQVDVGFGAPLWDIFSDDPNFYKGDGDNVVVLVSNVRDANYYTPDTPEGSTYIAGFHYSLFNEALDRNVMSIDAYDWLHRTGDNPPTDTEPNACGDTLKPRPRDYEGTFAHEYQHLLQYYVDSGEDTWLNEGLSDYAQTLVGYVDTTEPYGSIGADGHITCYQGFAGTAAFPYCGAENSLTRWEDQSNETLADYGGVYAFITYLADEFGEEAITFLHNDDANGLDSLQDYLDDFAPGLTTSDLIHDFVAQMALDRWVDRGAKGLIRDQKDRFTSEQLSSAIDWSWTGSYDTPGAPTNGADYVLAAGARPFNANTVGELRFVGAKSYAPDQLEWTMASDGSLWSGEGDDVDRAAVVSVNVPVTGATLSFDSTTEIETGWDFGVVQVSTDGGETYTSLANANTTDEHDPAAAANIVDELPGFTGTSAKSTQTFDLSAYQGKTVLLSFRYLTDAASNGNGADPTGWWVSNVKVGTTPVDLSSARSATQVNPVEVDGWSVQVVGWTLNGKKVAYRDVSLNANQAATVTKKQMKKAFKGMDRIAVIVVADDPHQLSTKYASYSLRVGGVLQPGGGGSTTANKVVVSKTDIKRS